MEQLTHENHDGEATLWSKSVATLARPPVGSQFVAPLVWHRLVRLPHMCGLAAEAGEVILRKACNQCLHAKQGVHLMHAKQGVHLMHAKQGVHLMHAMQCMQWMHAMQ
eukprot:2126618-Alexandrium_andersonii.AAC.1